MKSLKLETIGIVTVMLMIQKNHISQMLKLKNN